MAIIDSLFSLNGQTAIVIGGTGVLGGAMAEALAGAGARVAIVGRSRERGEARAAGIAETGGIASFYSADAADRQALEHAAEAIGERYGAPHILVNAAGGNHPDATLKPGDEFGDLPLEAWRGVFDLNLLGGVFVPCQVFGEVMLQAGRGSIVNIASLAGMTPLSRVPAYSAAKAAVLNLTCFLAREWALRGVRVNALSPGFFPAEQNRALLFKPDNTPTERGAQILAHTPMGRYGVADELAGALLWLASSRASGFVTGQNIVVDGGFSATTL